MTRNDVIVILLEWNIHVYTCSFYTIETVKRFKWSFSWPLFAYRNNKLAQTSCTNDDFVNRFCTLSRIGLNRCARAGTCVCVCVCVYVCEPRSMNDWKKHRDILANRSMNLSWKDLHFFPFLFVLIFFTWFRGLPLVFIFFFFPPLSFKFYHILLTFSLFHLFHRDPSAFSFFFFNYFWNSNLQRANQIVATSFQIYTSAVYSFWKVEPICF